MIRRGKEGGGRKETRERGRRLEKERKGKREKEGEGRKETSKVECRLEKEGEGRKRFQNDQHRYVATSL